MVWRKFVWKGHNNYPMAYYIILMIIWVGELFITKTWYSIMENSQNFYIQLYFVSITWLLVDFLHVNNVYKQQIYWYAYILYCFSFSGFTNWPIGQDKRAGKRGDGHEVQTLRHNSTAQVHIPCREKGVPARLRKQDNGFGKISQQSKQGKKFQQLNF